MYSLLGPGTVNAPRSVQVTFNGNPAWVDRGTSVTSQSWQSEAVGEDTPNYWLRRNAGELLRTTHWRKNSMAVDTANYQFHMVGGPWYDGYAWNSVDEPGFPLGLPGGPSAQQLQDWQSCLNGELTLQNALANMQNGWDALTFVAELKPALSMIQTAFQRLFRLVNDEAFLRRALRYSKGNVLSANSLYLEVRYGWRPLIADMHNIAKLIHSYNEARANFFHGRSTEATSWTEDDEGVLENKDPYVEFYTRRHVIELSGRAVASSKVAPPKIVVNPLLTGWELIPLSFVVDWFLNVGNSIQALQTRVLHPDLDLCYGTRLSVRTEVTTRLAPTPSVRSCSGGGTYVLEQEWVYRNPASSPYLPQIRPLTKALTGWHLADAAALLYQRLFTLLRRKK